MKVFFIFGLFILTMKAFAAPPATPTDIVGNVPVCSGSSRTFSITHSGGADGYYWVITGPSWSVASATTSSTINTITAGPESGTLSVWAFNVDGSSGTYTEVIPQLGDISGINEPGGFHCSGVSKTYTVDPVILADYYTWSISPSSWTISSSSSTWAEVIGGTGDAELSVFASNICESSNTVTIQIVPSPPPLGILATDPGPHCPGTSNTYTIAPVSGATDYSWFLESGDPGWSSTPSTTTAFVVSSGTATTGPATILVAANNVCGSSETISRIIDTFGGPTNIIATPAGGHCNNSSKTYSISPVEHATSYTWFFNGGTQWSSSSSTTTWITVTSGTLTTTSATLSVCANNDCGSSSTFTKIIDPLYTPSSPVLINKPATHCYGTIRPYSVNPVVGATTYLWGTNNSNWGISGTGSSVNITAGSGSATISVSASNNCGTSAPVTTTVEPWYSPPTATITQPAFHCSGTTATYTAASNMYASDYSWYVKGTGWSGSSTMSSIVVTAGASSGTISVVANGYCGSSGTYTVEVNPIFIPEKSTRIYTPPYHCQNQIRTYACAPVTGATSYTWMVSGTGWSGASTTNYIDLRAGSTSALITVRANSSCGSSDTTSITVVPEKTPIATAGIYLPGLHCTGTVKTYSVATIPGASQYTWAIRNASNATIPWTANRLTGRDIDFTAGSQSATITVFATNRCGDGTVYSTVFVPDHTPNQPGSITAPADHCEGTAQQYSIANVSGADSYIWSVTGAGWSVSSSNTNECDITAGGGQGVISVKAVNDCGPGTARTLTVRPDTLPDAPLSISKPALHCSGSTEVYSVPAVSGATAYVWTVNGSGGWSGTSTARTINITAGTGDATISARAINPCGQSPARTITSTAIPLPSSAFAINRDTICRDETVTVTYTGGASLASSFAWDFDGGTASPGSGRGPHSVMWFDNPGTRTIKLVVTQDGCPSQERLVSVFVDNCLGVNDKNEGNIKVELMPNPTNGIVTLKLSNSQYNIAELQVVNNLGQRVYSVQLTDIGEFYHKDLNLIELEAGLYYVKLVMKDYEIVRRLVIIK